MNALFKPQPVELETATHSIVQAYAEQHQRCTVVSLDVAEEVPVALVYNGISHVVLMATPQQLVELAYGFSLSEGIIDYASQIYSVDVKTHQEGMTVQIALATSCFAKLKQRRRQMTGRTGCGLCGIEALHQMNASLPAIDQQLQISMDAAQLSEGFAQMMSLQAINRLTGGCHAAALWQPNVDGLEGRLQVFEDVGRHNAMDKLIGWRLLNGNPLGAVLLTSRLSYELIQKAAYAQLPLLAAISAPTAMAVRLAADAGIQLAVFVREGRVTWI